MSKRIDKKWIYFESRNEFAGKHESWDVANSKSDEPLALICWYPAWRQYVVQPDAGAVFSWDCLQDIVDFLKQLNVKKSISTGLRG